MRLILILLACFNVLKASSFVGNYQLTFSGSARALALGQAYSSVKGESASIYFNPSLIAGKTDFEFSLFHSFLFHDSRYTFISSNIPIYELTNLGISLLHLASDKVQKISELGRPRGEFFNDSYYTLYVTISRLISKKISVGANLKSAMQVFDNLTSYGFGLDLSANFLPHEKISIGLVIQNLLPPVLKWEKDVDKYPLTVRTGASLNLFKGLLISADYSRIVNRNMLFFGSEYLVKFKMLDLFIRGGVNYKFYCFGLGFNTRTMAFDLSISQHVNLGLVYGVNLSFIPFGYREIVSPWDRKKAEKHYKIAVDCFNKKEYEKAKENIYESLSYFKDYEPAKSLLEKVNIELEKIEKAKAEKERREKALGLFEKALEEMGKGNFPVAGTYLDEAKKLLPAEIATKVKDHEAKFLKSAKELIDKADYKKAESELRKVLLLNPGNVEAKRLLDKVLEILEFLR